MYKRLISFLMVFCLTLSFASVSLYADEAAVAQTGIGSSSKITNILLPNKDGDGDIEFVTLDADFKLLCENENYELYLNEKTTNIGVKDKSNDYIWTSSPLNLNADGMSGLWQNFLNSILVMDYVKTVGTDDSRSYSANPKANAPVFTKHADGVDIKLHFADADINLVLQIRLTKNGITAEVPDSTIEQLGENKIGKLMIMPAFGTVYADAVPGYMFVPDGSGAIMRFSNPRIYKNFFSGMVFGGDTSIENINNKIMTPKKKPPVALQQLYLPVFGVAHGSKDNAFVGIIESGKTHSMIFANPAGSMINYSWVAPSFVYYEIFTQPVSATSSFTTSTTQMNEVNAKVSYNFLNGNNADYSGMANKYREYLIDTGVLVKKEQAGEIPVKMDVLMADQFRSIFGTTTKAITKFDDVNRWAGQLKNSDFSNVIFSFVGAEAGGLNGRKLDTYKIEGKIGGESGLSKLSEQLKNYGYSYTIQKNILSGYEKQVSSGDRQYAVSGAFTNEIINRPLFKQSFFVQSSVIEKYIDNLAKQKTYKQNISLDRIANSLTSNHKRNSVETRNERYEIINNSLAKAAETSNLLMLDAPNEYAFKYADKVYNTPNSSSMQIYESESVPFYQIVLSGYTEMFSPYLNYHANNIEDVLRIIDYNMYPSYLLTEAEPNVLLKTNIVDVYSSKFDDWEEKIQSQYEMINEVLKNVRGKSISDRTTVADSVVVVTYDDGSKIIVNYSDAKYDYEGNKVDAKSALYVRGN